MVEKQESKRSSDPHKDKKRAKKYEAKLADARLALKDLSHDLVVSLSDFKESYLDWFEPLINILVQMQIRHPHDAIDHLLKDASLPTLRLKLQSTTESLRSAFRNASHQQPRNLDEVFRGGLSAFVRYPLALRYFRAFAEQERVSESLDFYLAVLSYKSLWHKHSTGGTMKASSQPSSASSNRGVFSSSAYSGPSPAHSSALDYGIVVPELDFGARRIAGSGSESPTVSSACAHPLETMDSLTQQARSIADQFLKDGGDEEINVPQADKLDAIHIIDSGVVSESTFDKSFTSISEMLEESYMHFQSSQLATQLQARLKRISDLHSRLLTTNAAIPTLADAAADPIDTSPSGKHSTTYSPANSPHSTPHPRLGERSREATRSMSHLSVESNNTNDSSNSRSSEDLNRYRADGRPVNRERRQRSDSGNGTGSRNAALKRAASSGEIDSSAVIQRPNTSSKKPALSSSPKTATTLPNRPPPKLDLPLSSSPTETRITSLKSATAPVEAYSVSRNHLQSDIAANLATARDSSPSSTAREHTSPHPSARGMRTIISSLAGLLGPKTNKSKKKDGGNSPRGLQRDGSSDDLKAANLSALQQSNDLGSMATRHLVLMSNHFRELLENPIGADFVIRCGPDGVLFYGHSLVFSTRWPMFVREYPHIFAEDGKGGSENVVEVSYPTVDPEIFSLAMEYIYTGTFTLGDHTDRQLMTLSEFAKYGQLPGLKELANSHVLSRKPTNRIVARLAEYIQSTSSSGDMLHLEQDSKYAAFIAALAARGHELVQLPLFEHHQLYRLRRIDMVNLIRRDDFCAPSEATVFQLLLAWADRASPDKTTLMENLSFLVAHVRLPLMTKEELQWVSSLGWVPQNLTAEAFKFKETGVASHPTRTKPRKLPPNTSDVPSTSETPGQPFLANLDILSPRVMNPSTSSGTSSPVIGDRAESPRTHKIRNVEKASRRASTGREKKRSAHNLTIATAGTHSKHSEPSPPISPTGKSGSFSTETSLQRASSNSPPRRKRTKSPKEEATSPPLQARETIATDL